MGCLCASACFSLGAVNGAQMEASQAGVNFSNWFVKNCICLTLNLPGALLLTTSRFLMLC